MKTEMEIENTIQASGEQAAYRACDATLAQIAPSDRSDPSETSDSSDSGPQHPRAPIRSPAPRSLCPPVQNSTALVRSHGLPMPPLAINPPIHSCPHPLHHPLPDGSPLAVAEGKRQGHATSYHAKYNEMGSAPVVLYGGILRFILVNNAQLRMSEKALPLAQYNETARVRFQVKFLSPSLQGTFIHPEQMTQPGLMTVYYPPSSPQQTNMPDKQTVTKPDKAKQTSTKIAPTNLVNKPPPFVAPDVTMPTTFPCEILNLRSEIPIPHALIKPRLTKAQPPAIKVIQAKTRLPKAKQASTKNSQSSIDHTARTDYSPRTDHR